MIHCLQQDAVILLVIRVQFRLIYILPSLDNAYYAEVMGLLAAASHVEP
jgi:hypothetical protein